MSTVRSFFAPRIRQPPTLADPATALWLQEVANALNEIPPLSTFSYSTPNSNVTAQLGTLGINYDSSTSVCWIKQVGSGNTGWVAIA